MQKRFMPPAPALPGQVLEVELVALEFAGRVGARVVRARAASIAAAPAQALAPRPGTDLEAAILQAGRTLKAQPMPGEVLRLARIGSSLQDLEPAPGRAMPSAAEITQLDQVLGWLQLLDQEDRHLVALRMQGTSWRKMKRHYPGRSHEALRRWFKDVLAQLAEQV